MKRNVNHFGTIYGLLAFVLLVAVFGAFKGLTYHAAKADPTVAHKSDIASALRQDIGQTACKFTTQSAANQGVILRSCVVTSVKVKGDQATVLLKQVDTGGTKYTVEVKLLRGIWTATSFQVKS